MFLRNVKNRKLYKVLQGNKSCHGGDFEWSLPNDNGFGDWTPIIENVELHYKGYHLTTHYAHWSDKDNISIYEAQGDVVAFDDYDKVVCSKARLLWLVENPFSEYNIGKNNSGSNNFGNYNSGNYNFGDRNSGNWNYSSYNFGYFCTKYDGIFNKFIPENWKPKFPKWIYFELLQEGYHASWQKAFEKSNVEGIKELLVLPNFDYEIFEEITSITKRQIDKKLVECPVRKILKIDKISNKKQESGIDTFRNSIDNNENLDPITTIFLKGNEYNMLANKVLLPKWIVLRNDPAIDLCQSDYKNYISSLFDEYYITFVKDKVPTRFFISQLTFAQKKIISTKENIRDKILMTIRCSLNGVSNYLIEAEDSSRSINTIKMRDRYEVLEEKWLKEMNFSNNSLTELSLLILHFSGLIDYNYIYETREQIDRTFFIDMARIYNISLL